MSKKIGFISLRFAGTDGVSLETAKWASILQEEGHECFYLAGEIDTPPERSMEDPLLHFQSPIIKNLNNKLFSRTIRTKETTELIYEIKKAIKQKIYDFVNKFDIDLIIPENALAIPLNVPLGLAITEFIAETSIPVIAHHHDFFWERKRFLRNSVWDYLNSCFPCRFPSMFHVVINSSAQHQLGLRTGIAGILIPNVMDFEKPPTPPDDYIVDLKKNLGMDEDELLFLQPTRVVQRKGIEHAIELVARMKRKAALVISHASGDEGNAYNNRVKDYIKLMGVRAIFADDIITDQKRYTREDGRKVYTLEDVYNCCDFVTYPSVFEGFGNAFLEAIYYKKPIFVNNYSIYYYDIRPKGFRAIEMDDFVSDETVATVKRVIDNKDIRDRMVFRNYQLGLKHYSYALVRTRLRHIMTAIWGHTGGAD
ncbi:MAG: glycosyltransferase family 4 protein [Spirochaetaceae bacterium]|nr:glycosyltransferase family 4 protein [Spirochaetaceae bacterium]